MDIVIRLATDADIAAMHQVRKAVRENRLSDRSSITYASYVPYVKGQRAWVAEVAGTIAGFAAIDAEAGTVWALFVAPAHSGIGVGRALHAALLDGARAAGCAELSLTTEAESRAALFYRRSGWTQHGLTSDGQLLFKRPA
ncbi:GNAT family N-acetyltransferase [Sphingomonas humi]|uniref:GNAT family N-acetyltransferase n=1 Tax=Sphingomonas humi TaxID=335630 RepID=UPI0031CF1421